MAALILGLCILVAGKRQHVLTQAQTTDCNATCIATMASAWEATQHASNDFSFYDVPSNFSQDLQPGQLLRLEAATPMVNYTVPYSLTMSRMLYTTTDVHGNVLPTSGYILWPYTLPNNESGYPMIAWAHGSSGLFKPCAPSNYRSLQYHFMVPWTLALEGMAIVAPDYAGLGVSHFPSGEEIHHQWVTGPSQANDLANAILAARSAFPDLLHPEGPFVAVGHSQGAGATWSFAEKQVEHSIPGYKGTVSIAPPTRFIDSLETALKNTSVPFYTALAGSQVRLIAAVTSVFPAFNYTGLTTLASELWFNAVRKVGGCFPTDIATFSGVEPDELAIPGWTEHPLVKEWANLTNLGTKAVKGPMLLIAAKEDQIVPAEFVKPSFKHVCSLSKGENLEMVAYEGMQHFSVIQASQATWLGWVKERFAGEGGDEDKGRCEERRVEGFRTELAPAGAGASANFLVEWVDPKEGWKYVL